jgi:DNA polymerase-3 subunit alpha
MAFVTLEDVQGTIDLVIFPRTWEKVSGVVDFERIILVDGKVDLAGAEPKVIVDSISTEFSMLTPLKSHSQISDQKALTPARPVQNIPENTTQNGFPDRQSSKKQIQDNSEVDVPWLPPSGDLTDSDDLPPQPDEFPPDWGQAVLPQKADPDSDESAKIQEPRKEIRALPVDAPVVSQPTNDRVEILPPYLVPPAVRVDENVPVRMITIILRSTGDKARDQLRLRRIHGIITSYPGNDRFAFHIFERGRGYLLEFPNFTAGLCTDMIARLSNLVGAENIRVEPVTFL